MFIRVLKEAELISVVQLDSVMLSNIFNEVQNQKNI